MTRSMLLAVVLLSVLSVFSFILLRRKIAWPLLTAFIGAALAWALYCFACSSFLWGAELSDIAIHRILAITNLAGSLSAFALLYAAKLLHRPFLYGTAFLIFLALPLVIAGNSPDEIQGGLNLPFIMYLATLLDASVVAAVVCWKKRGPDNIFVMVGLLLTTAAGINDVLITSGIVSGIMLVPIGVAVLLTSIAPLMHRNIDAVYTERDIAQEALFDANKDKQRLFEESIYARAVTNATQMIAHDLKRPFALLKFAVHEAQSPHFRQERLKLILEHIGDNFAYVDKLIQDLLFPGRHKRLDAESCELVALVSEASNLFKKDEFIISFDENAKLNLYVDKAMITRVFHNLISNAIEASTMHPTRIWVKARKVLTHEGTHKAEICFGNADSFIPEDDLNDLFSKFKTKGKDHGTGLGLAICYEFILAHGGQIKCQSSKEEGTEFIFSLPT